MADEKPVSGPDSRPASTPTGITKVAMLGLGDPGMIPLWFGESDLVTPKFIRDAATKALDDGKTFYTWARGIPRCAKRSRLSPAHRWRRRVDPERITVPGAAMLAISMRSAMRGGDRRQCGDRLAGLAQHLPGRAGGRRGGAGWCGWTRIGTPATGSSISRNCSTPATPAPRRSSSPRPAIPPAG